ncbi:MAG TPA: hypothetical protein VEH84_07345 [Alphaproteobacteria bacterium]|nr:hypothetical protein [Alphaproteobacteria bacterium]
MKPIAIATDSAHAALTADDQLLVGALARLGAAAAPAVWDDPAVDWRDYRGVVMRSCWDYHLKPAAFLAWLDRLDGLGIPAVNRTELLRWNADKRYLAGMADQGIATVPTVFLAPGEAASLGAIAEGRGWTELVVKPTVSASARDTRRIAVPVSAEDEAWLRERLRSGGMMVQPFLPGIADGELSLCFFDGAYSHTVLKRPNRGDFRVQGGTVEAVEPPRAIVEAAAAALAAAPGRTAYARVDGVPSGDAFTLLELELIEPFLFLGRGEAAADRFAAAVLAALD